MRTVAVLGAGSWGTALAIHLGRLGHRVPLWARDARLVDDMTTRRANAVYLPDVNLPPAVVPTASLADAVRDAALIVLAVPSHGVRDVLAGAAASLHRDAVLLSAAKGIEEHSLLRVSEIVADVTARGHRVAVLSGPSFAMEVARELPTAVLVASASAEAVTLVQEELRGQFFRLYGSDDVVGVEVGGALKNVIAIAAGVVEGLGLGHNALAALITRGLAEITRLSVAMGGRRETLAGLGGLGDLVLTCTGSLSRNRHVGVELGRGRALPDILAGMKMVAEGVRTTHAAVELGRRHGVELPISEKMAALFAGEVDARTAVADLMLRRQRPELDA
jgi:glycerol-3-phosphate dehydrogenase (NAD(P)+)